MSLSIYELYFEFEIEMAEMEKKENLGTCLVCKNIYVIISSFHF